MVVIEMKNAAYEAAFELIDEAKHNEKKQKMTLCELEDAIYDCYEASKSEEEEFEPSEFEIGLRSRKGYRHEGRYEHEDDDDEKISYGMRRMNRRIRKGMRRDRMGRYAA